MKRTAVLVAAAAVPLLASAFLMRPSAERKEPVRRSPVSSPIDGSEAAIDPMAGLPQTSAGATAAAVRITRLAAQPVRLAEGDAVALQASVATNAGLPVLAERLRDGLQALDELGDRSRMTFWTAPIAARLERYDTTGARVSVWYVGVLDVPGLRSAEQWRTVTYDLTWERGGWREAAEHAVDGPTPQRLYGAEPTALADGAARLAGFEPVSPEGSVE